MMRNREREMHAREPLLDCDAVNIGTADLLAQQPCAFAGHVYSGGGAKQRRALKVRTPESGDDGFFGVTLEPIRRGYAGRVAVAGVALCRLKNPDHLDAAEIVAGGDYLQGAAEGGAQILWDDEFAGSDTHLGLVRFPRGGGGGWIADAATTANHALSGTASVDGQSISGGGKKVLAWKQTTVSQNGFYLVSALGVWTKLSQPDAVDVKAGALYGLLRFLLVAANNYKPNKAVWG
jgi:hypothetical protein